MIFFLFFFFVKSAHFFFFLIIFLKNHNADMWMLFATGSQSTVSNLMHIVNEIFVRKTRIATKSLGAVKKLCL